MRRLRKGLPAPTTTGYQILDASDPVGAVEVTSEGAVWLREAVPTGRRSLLAATAAALLLLEDLRAHLPDEGAVL